MLACMLYVLPNEPLQSMQFLISRKVFNYSTCGAFYLSYTLVFALWRRLSALKMLTMMSFDHMMQKLIVLLLVALVTS